jgi:hypothetical protein
MRQRPILRSASIILLTVYALTSLPAQTPKSLDQGWTPQQRARFYITSQGSQLIPLAWFLALEQDNGSPFTQDLTRYGFLPSLVNANGLPVGFTVDNQAGTWAGLNCSACHTNQVEYQGTTMQLDGGPTNADLYAFIAELTQALEKTLSDSARFDRFANKIPANNESRQELRNELTRFSAYFSTYVNSATPKNPWGPARADAFGLIFNRVAAIDLSDRAVWQWFHSLETNNRQPNAPVSYPYLWGVSRMDKVQWNGVADNTSCIKRLGRNVGEVLGVFARIQLTPSITGYKSTAAISDQVMLEETLIKHLKSPQWSDPNSNLPPIDKTKKAQGEALYRKYCVNCHVVIDRNSSSRVTVNLTPLSKIGTDPAMAEGVACRTANTGSLAGTAQPVVGGTKLKPTDYVLNLAQNAVSGAIVNNPPPLSCLLNLSAKASAAAQPKKPAQTSVQERQTLAKRIPPVYKRAIGTGNCITALEQYIGRPLDGIWATAPYLHNGSVPSLYQLLLPANQRVAKFKVGSRVFDPVNVGFDITTGSFEFDTSLPGNSNSGHEYGTNLTEAQRQQLLEYLKAL